MSYYIDWNWNTVAQSHPQGGTSSLIKAAMAEMETDYPFPEKIRPLVVDINETNSMKNILEDLPHDADFDTLEELWKIMVNCKVHLDEEGRPHSVTGPALVDAGGAEYWAWHGKYGLHNFPDEGLAALGDTVI